MPRFWTRVIAWQPAENRTSVGPAQSLINPGKITEMMPVLTDGIVKLAALYRRPRSQREDGNEKAREIRREFKLGLWTTDCGAEGGNRREEGVGPESKVQGPE